MLWFPFGHLHKQINDGRYGKMLQFFHRRLPSNRFQKLVHSTYSQFMKELLSFNEKFNEFVAERDNRDYQNMKEDHYDFFSQYNFDYNEDLEDHAYNFMSG